MQAIQMDELLDNPSVDQKEDDYKSIIKWWERKRIIYNLVIIFVQVTIALNEWMGVLRWGISDVLIGSALFLLIANGFYTFGWALEFLIQHYFSRFKLKPIHRLLIFILGLLFSVFITGIVHLTWLHVDEI